MKALRYLADHWYLPLAALVVLCGAVFALATGNGRSAKRILRNLSAELAAIRTKRAVREVEIEHGVKLAVEEVERKYADELKRLDEEEVHIVEELSNDPQKLAMALERATRRRNGGGTEP